LIAQLVEMPDRLFIERGDGRSGASDRRHRAIAPMRREQRPVNVIYK